MRRIFLIVFLLSLLSFPIFLILAPGLYAHSALLHVMVFCVAMMSLWKDDLRSTLDGIGFPGSIKRTLIYTFAGLALFVFVLMSLAFTALWFGFADQDKVMDKVQDLPVYLLAFAIFLAPVSEELFFRAFLIGRIREITGPRTGELVSSASAIILSSVLFGLLHLGYGSIVEIAGAGLMGAVLGIVYVRSGSITPPLLMHLLYNLASISFMRLSA